MSKRDVFMIHVNPGGSVFVKTLKFFREQKGFEEGWGLVWKPVVALDIEHARMIGCKTLPGARSYNQHPVSVKDIERYRAYEKLSLQEVLSGDGAKAPARSEAKAPVKPPLRPGQATFPIGPATLMPKTSWRDQFELTSDFDMTALEFPVGNTSLVLESFRVEARELWQGLPLPLLEAEKLLKGVRILMKEGMLITIEICNTGREVAFLEGRLVGEMR